MNENPYRSPMPLEAVPAPGRPVWAHCLSAAVLATATGLLLRLELPCWMWTAGEDSGELQMLAGCLGGLVCYTSAQVLRALRAA